MDNLLPGEFTPQDTQDAGSLASLLGLSKEDVEQIMKKEFGEKITQSKGFDGLIESMIH